MPPLLYREPRRFNPKTNPFLQRADAQLFLARRNGQVIGRISAQVDHEHNRFHEERTRQYLAMAYLLCDEIIFAPGQPATAAQSSPGRLRTTPP